MKKIITDYFGEEFCNKAMEYLNIYTDKWQLDLIELIHYFSINLLFKCHSVIYGDCVLKIGSPWCVEVIEEINTLSDYNGKSYCELYAADRETGVFLIELITPGSTMSIDIPTQKFADLYNELHIDPIHEYPTYLDWIEVGIKNINTVDGYAYLRESMYKAKEVYYKIAAEYTDMKLLHGDLHHDNILLGTEGYKIVDPKGVVGSRVFDASRFILNRFGDDLSSVPISEVCDFIEELGEAINIPSDILKKCLFIEAAIWVCREECWDYDEYSGWLRTNITIAESLT
jgi:Streptomycin 6-kinase